MTGISSYNSQLTPVNLLYTEKRGQAVLALYLLWHFQPPSFTKAVFDEEERKNIIRIVKRFLWYVFVVQFV